ncbi:glycine dehydrogenase [Bacillus cereus]|uniref:Glycine dehydrogenase n=1 Tax=Bacillus cereus TaxID=1396 RepID=A0A2A7I2M9_BACCE|nr:glycine dehydrogenase [Bacillus cereus]
MGIKKNSLHAGSFFVWRICAEIVKKMLKIYIFCFILL